MFHQWSGHLLAQSGWHTKLTVTRWKGTLASQSHPLAGTLSRKIQDLRIGFPNRCQRSSSWTPPPITAPLGLGFVALTGLPLRYSQSAHLANWLEFVLVGSGCHKVLHIGFRQQKLIFSPFGKSGVWGPRWSWADFFYHLSPWCVGDQLLQRLPSMHACVLTSSSYKDTAVLG